MTVVIVGFDVPACSAANCAGQKWEKESQMFERSEFLTLPIFALRNWVPEGQRYLRRLLLLTFLGEARKVSGRRATPGQRRLSFRDR